MENAQLMQNFLKQKNPGARDLQIMAQRVWHTMPFSSFIPDKKLLDQAHLSKLRQNDRKATPLVPALDTMDSEESGPIEDPTRPRRENYEDTDPLRGGLKYLTQLTAHERLNAFLKDVPFDGYVQMMGAQGNLRGVNKY